MIANQLIRSYETRVYYFRNKLIHYSASNKIIQLSLLHPLGEMPLNLQFPICSPEISVLIQEYC